MNETVEEVEIEKRTYSPQYVDAMFESVKQYLPPGVWEKLHQQVMPKAGGMAAAENRRAAAQEAQTAAEGAVESAQAAATQQDVNAEQGIGKQDLPSGMNNTDQTSPSSQGCPDCRRVHHASKVVQVRKPHLTPQYSNPKNQSRRLAVVKVLWITA